MTLKINGVDILPYVQVGGLKWQRNDLDSSDAGRALNGMMYRGRVTSKIRLDITCRNLTETEAQTLLSLIYFEYVTVEYDDPMFGHRVCTMYSNNNTAELQIVFDAENSLWSGIEFPLIER